MGKLEMAVIHDLKNKLQSLSLKYNHDVEHKDEIGCIMDVSSKLTSLLLLNKVSLDDFHINVDANSPKDSVEDALQDFLILHPLAKIELDLDAAPELWFYDKFYLELAINNGLQNAFRYAKSKIKISVFKKDNYLAIQISDDGPGFQEKILMAIHRGEWLAASKNGTGMGIRLTEMIMSFHVNDGKSGRLQILNHCAGPGASFLLLIP